MVQQPVRTDPAVVKLTQQLGQLRDTIVAGKHARLKLPPHVNASSLPAITVVSSSTLPSLPSAGLALPAKPVNSIFPPFPPPQPLSLPNVPLPPPPIHNGHVSLALPANITRPVLPISQLKTDVAQRRSELERTLHQQMQAKKNLTTTQTHAQEIVAEINVAKILEQAHTLVPPTSAASRPLLERAVSSSDSFDDNTFYSSQMNDSFTLDEAEVTNPWRKALRPCRYFQEGRPCPYGDKCTFSHAPTGSKHLQSPSHAVEKRQAAQPRNTSPIDQQTQRIAELEDQLRQLKDQQRVRSVVPRAIERPHAAAPPTKRGKKEEEIVKTQNYPHVVRNSAVSPFAPQPSQVSPLIHYGSSARDTISAVPRAHDSSLVHSRKRKRRLPGADDPVELGHLELAPTTPKIKQEPSSPVYQSFSGGNLGRQEPIVVEDLSLDHPRVPAYYTDRPQRSVSYRVEPPLLRPVSRSNILADPGGARRSVSTRDPRGPRFGEFDNTASSLSEVRRDARAVSQLPMVSLDRYGMPEQAAPMDQSLSSMPPPQSRRIVVDQYGNKFIEATVPAVRSVSVMPAQPAIYHEDRSDAMQIDSTVVPHRSSYMPQLDHRTNSIVHVDGSDSYNARVSGPTSQVVRYTSQVPQYLTAAQTDAYTTYGPQVQMRLSSVPPPPPQHRMQSRSHVIDTDEQPTNAYVSNARSIRHMSLMPQPMPVASRDDGRYLQYAPTEEHGRYREIYR